MGGELGDEGSLLSRWGSGKLSLGRLGRSFRFTAKSSGKFRDLPFFLVMRAHSPPHCCHPMPSVPFVPADETALRHHSHPKAVVYLRVLLVLYKWVLASVVTVIYHTESFH